MSPLGYDREGRPINQADPARSSHGTVIGTHTDADWDDAAHQMRAPTAHARGDVVTPCRTCGRMISWGSAQGRVVRYTDGDSRLIGLKVTCDECVTGETR
mgnify:CR=1 FL=1